MSSLNVLIVGDFYGGNRLSSIIDKENYQIIFGFLLNLIRSSDISVVNLESPLFSGNLIPIPKTGPHLKAGSNVLDALEFAGFDLVTLANNHILDYGFDGLKSTLNLLDKSNVRYVGAGNNIKKAREIRYIKKKNKIVSFVNFCENEWSIASDNQSGANPLDIIDNYNDIQLAKSRSDFTIVIFHGGIEYSSFPSLDFKKKCQFFVDAGADSVVCHHTHVVSGFEIYNERPIFYGIGNFIFDKKHKLNEDWNLGYGVMLDFDTKIRFELIPFKQCNGVIGLAELDRYERKAFFDKISDINSIILDDERLHNKFIEWSNKNASVYDSFLQPYSNKYLRGLFKRNLLPSFYNDSYYRLLLNLIRCESHRDVLIEMLKMKLSRKSDENSTTL